MTRDDMALSVPADPTPTHKTALPRRAQSWLPIVEQGCCCCSLRNCNLVQGWLSLLGNGVNIAKLLYDVAVPSSGTVCLYNGEYLVELGPSGPKFRPFRSISYRFGATATSTSEISENITDRCVYTTVENENPLQFGQNPYISTIMVIALVISIIACFVSWFFIKGIRENKPSLMVGYIRLQGVLIFVYLLVSIAAAVILGSVVLFFFLFAITCGLPLYFLICANSLHIKMVEELEAPPPARGTIALPPGASVVVPSGYGLSAPPPGAAVQAPYAPAYNYPPPPQYGQAPPYSPLRDQQQDEYPGKKVYPEG